MTDHQAVEETVRISGSPRYRHLASEANLLPAPNSPADYLRFCRETAARGALAPLAIAVDYGGRATGPCAGCPGFPPPALHDP